jgi:glutamine cyclotransferase
MLVPAVTLLVGCVPQGGPGIDYTHEVVNTYPHDPQAFTQGLVYDDGALFESTGKYGASTLREVEITTGNVLRSTGLAGNHFGEGLALVDGRLIQLTWKAETALVYGADTFAPDTPFTYSGEGWGLAYDGTRLIMSDGSAQLTFRDPDTFAVLGQVTVMDDRGLVDNLNELEYVDGSILANVWQTNQVAQIDPDTGQVTAWIDLTGLLTPVERASADVLNGIAYDPDGDRLFVTGKNWPKLFEIRLVEAK